MTTDIGIFDSIAQQIDQNLVQSQFITDKPGMDQLNLLRIMNLFFNYFSFQKCLQFSKQSAKIMCFHDKTHFAAFNL